jgi:hypothetical protein
VKLLALIMVAAAAASGGERDDPRGRIRALELLDGPRTPEAQLGILRAAESEALKYGLRAGALRPARVPGKAWINLGPTSANFEVNGGTYTKVDSGRARSIAVDPRDANVVYLATAGGGVWKTYDALTPITDTTGPHWQPITETIGSLSIGALAMSPKNPDSLLLGLGDPFDVHTPGFLHSDDGGASWSTITVLAGSYPGSSGVYTATSVRDIKFNSAGTTVMVATDAGLFRSTTAGTGGGSSWTLLDLDSTTHDLQESWSVAYVGGQTWIVASVDVFASPHAIGKLWRTNDDGQSFTDVTARTGTTDLKRMTVATSAADQGDPAHARAYLLAEWLPQNHGNLDDQKDVFRSDDGGQHWASLGMAAGASTPSNPVPGDQPDLDLMHDQAFYNHMLVVDPINHDAVFIGGNLCMARSLLGGVPADPSQPAWTILTDWLPFAVQPSWPDGTYAHADWHAGTIAHVGGETYFYGGTDGGLIRNTNTFLTVPDNSAVWEDRLNRGIVSHLAYSVAAGNERAATLQCAGGGDAPLFGGLQDNGTRLRAGSDTIFNQVSGGDGFGVGMGCSGAGATSGSELLATYTSQISVSDDGGGTFTRTVTAGGQGLSPRIALDPSYTFLMRLASDLADPSGRSYLTPLTDTSQKGYVYRSTDGGQSWTSMIASYSPNNGGSEVAGPLPHPMKNVAVDPVNAGHYGAVSTHRAYTFVSTDATPWAETISLDLQSNLAFLAPQTLALDPTDNNVIWVGSKATQRSDGTVPAAHLFRCTSARSPQRCGSGGWTGMTNGLPGNVPVNVVKVDPGDAATVYVGTEIGLYRSTDSGASFSLYGTGLPLVSVTDIAVAANGGSLRIATFGRGFWEIDNDTSAAAGVHGSGDFDSNQQIDGFDLVRESALLFSDSSMDDYSWVGNLVSPTNSIGLADLSALLGKLGGRP